VVTRHRDKKAAKRFFRKATTATCYRQASKLSGCAPGGFLIRHPPNRAIRKQPS
jgi:hypothetical protein